MRSDAAKEYVIGHLPCTVSSFERLFRAAFMAYFSSIMITGMTPKAMGYSRLVITCLITPEPVDYKWLKEIVAAWFGRMDCKVERLTFERDHNYVWWVKTPLEMKEDRNGNAGRNSRR